MAILNNPMGALAAVNVQTVGSNVQSVGSVVANGARDRVVVVAAGKGNHEMYTCCGLCEDIEQHNFAFDRLYRQTMSALQSGDLPGGIALGAEATEEYYALKDAVEIFGLRCGELTDVNCAKHCTTPPEVS